MKPICVPCQRFFKIKRNGVAFVEQMPKHGNPAPGTAEPENWQPYKLWVGDLYECKGCGAQTISGVGFGPVAEHYQENFNELVQRMNAELTINDC